MDDEEGRLYLGLDLSTQKLKGLVIDDQCQIKAECTVDFQEELSHFGLTNGVRRHEDGHTFTVPVELWLEAIDRLFRKLAKTVLLDEVRAVSGCAQQHGTVFWSEDAEILLRNLNPKFTLTRCLQGAFSSSESPIWMDSSTSEECDLLEQRIGGAKELATITGSRAYHRFSGPQIMKMFRKRKGTFDLTRRISLVSSFVPTILCGCFVDIDMGDAGGMNILDVLNGRWNEACLNAIVDRDAEELLRLKNKIGNPVPCNTIVGKISNYFIERYGFTGSCQVVAFTGDNLSAFAGMLVQTGEVAVSLGTSDTVLFSAEQYLPGLEGHLFTNPVNPGGYMAMLCFKNGALTRNRVKESVGAEAWLEFGSLALKMPPGNNGNLGFYFDENEIIPRVKKSDHRFDSGRNLVESFPPEVEARAVLEHQCLAKRLHMERLGKVFDNEANLVLTGGASENPAIHQILADVLNCRVYITQSTNAAALGGALRARHARDYADGDFFEESKAALTRELVATPKAENVQVYNSMVRLYEELEEKILEENSY